MTIKSRARGRAAKVLRAVAARDADVKQLQDEVARAIDPDAFVATSCRRYRGVLATRQAAAREQAEAAIQVAFGRAIKICERKLHFTGQRAGGWRYPEGQECADELKRLMGGPIERDTDGNWPFWWSYKPAETR